MRRSPALAGLCLLLAACVTIEPPPNPFGAVKPGQRMVVLVNQSPGPWIVADPDSKAETALKILPLGTFLQGIQEDRINDFSKEIQPYLPRPRYDRAVEEALIKALKAAHGGAVQTAVEAGISPPQRKDWNAAADQLDWRRKYYFSDPGKISPRDYSRLLSLDDAVILDVNVSFGLEPDDQERSLPLLSATSRLYRADTGRMLWGREDRLSDATSSSTLSEFRAAPADLTDRLYLMSAPLAEKIAAGLATNAGLTPPAPPITAEAAPHYLNGALVDLSTPSATVALSSAPASVELPSAPAAVEASSAPATEPAPPR